MATSSTSMATSSSSFISPLSLQQKSSFLHKTKLIYAPPTSIKTAAGRCCNYKPPQANLFDHIPKQFHEENLKDGLMENYKDVPQLLYGLTPAQMLMFMTDENPISRQAENAKEESITSAYTYKNNCAMWRLSAMNQRGSKKYRMSPSMLAGGRGYGRARTAPPDLPSLLLDGRIIFLGMPIVPAVTELIVAQFMWLDFDDPKKPIYLYINSPGTQNEKKEIVGSETDAFAIADSMAYCKADVYTVNFGMAFGQAAMLMSLGKKGYRYLQPNAYTKLYLPKVHKSSGASSDMWIKANELDSNKDIFLELLAKGVRKPQKELEEDIRYSKFFTAQEAIDYGIADKIIKPSDKAFEKRDWDQIRAESNMMKRVAAARDGSQAAASGSR